MGALHRECERAGLDAAVVDRLANRLERVAKDAKKLGLTIFAGLCLSLRYESDTIDGRTLIVADTTAGNCDGGDGACWEDNDGYMRGE